jgi:hypothetical protein
MFIYMSMLTFSGLSPYFILLEYTIIQSVQDRGNCSLIKGSNRIVNLSTQTLYRHCTGVSVTPVTVAEVLPSMKHL